MFRQLKGSIFLLVTLGVIFSIPIVAVGYSVHGYDLALLAAALVILLVCMGPLSFIFASSIATAAELTMIAVIGALLLFAWIRAARDPQRYTPYLTVTGWALLGAYFCVSLYFEHAL